MGYSTVFACTLVLLFSVVPHTLAQAAECTALLGPYFAANNPSCLRTRITIIDNANHFTTYSEGILSFNSTYNAFVNRADIDNFPAVTSTDHTCVDGIVQPFAASRGGGLAPFSPQIQVSRSGVLTLRDTAANIIQEVQFTCLNATGTPYFYGIDKYARMLVFEFQAVPLGQPCPGQQFLESCDAQQCGDTVCEANQICVSGSVCYYKDCNNVNCPSGQVCISDGGYGRCIETSQNTPVTPPPSPPPPPPESICTGSISATARPGGSWMVNGMKHQIYDITFENTGTKDITGVIFKVSGSNAGRVDAMWNMAPTSNAYALVLGGKVKDGQSNTSAGFTWVGTGTASATIKTVAC